MGYDFGIETESRSHIGSLLMSTTTSLDELCINTIRTLSVDGVQKAESGHPGLPMGGATMAYALWMRQLKFNPKNPKWPDRDRFVLSAGHGSILLYSLLYLTGFDVSLDDIKNFRQLGSKTPGHPESHLTPGVEATTGPLGQGVANAVGMAMAEQWLAAHFNRPGHEIVDHYTYALVSDGDMMEGIASEASSLAGHLKLNKLIFLYDDNKITLDGPAEWSFSEDVSKRFEAYGWHVQSVDGMDVEAVSNALETAKAEKNKPSFISCRTIIGFGSPNKAGTSSVHGSPLGKDEIKATKDALGWPADKDFYVPEDALNHFRQAVDKGKDFEADWLARMHKYEETFPELAKEWRMAQSGQFPAGWDKELPTFNSDEKVATRTAFGKTLNAIAPIIPWLIGGSADLASSNDTDLKGEEAFEAGSYGGRIIHFGVREHGMGGAVNGMVYHGGVKPFCATFMVFSDYMRGSVRISALAELDPLFIWTHDSVFLGEDGPTHQPVETLAVLRAIPNLVVIRPSDANETAVGLAAALDHKGGPSTLILSRQKLPVFDRTKYGSAEGLKKGAYILAGSPDEIPEVIIIATGSEVQLALGAYDKLVADGVKARVVAMPCWEFFEAQPDEYKKNLLPPTVKARLSVEAGTSFGWRQWVGDSGDMISIDRFGISAPLDDLLKFFGFTVDNVYQKAKALLDK